MWYVICNLRNINMLSRFSRYCKTGTEWTTGCSVTFSSHKTSSNMLMSFYSWQCQFCEKSFLNYSYLQAHVQRRHPEVTDSGWWKNIVSVIFLAKFNTISDIGELVIHLNLINGVVENNCLITQYHCLYMCLRETKEAEGRRDGR